MQALNIQFLNQQAVSREKVDVGVKQSSSSNSFKSLLEKASASKKSDVKKASLPTNEKESNVTVAQEESEGDVAFETKSTENDKQKLASNTKETSDSTTKDNKALVKDKVAEAPLPTAEQNYNELISLVITQQEQTVPLSTNNFVDSQNTNDIALQQELTSASVDSLDAIDSTEALQNEVLISNITIQKGSDSFANENVPEAIPLEVAQAEESFESLVTSTASKEEGATSVGNEEIIKDSENKNRVAKKDTTSTSLEENATQKSIFTVVDERGKVSKEADLQKDTKEIISEVTKQNVGTIENSMNLANTAEQNILSSNNQVASATGSTFQEMLSNQIQQNAPEFVKAGSIILKDSNTGTINMNLKPESLGNVKISLQLSDKGIEGQITVASKEAFEAFKQNIDTLKTAFQQSGFDTTNFSLSFASNGDTSSFQREQQQQDNQFYANKTFGNYAQEAESSSSTQGVASAYSSSSDHHIDVVA